MHEGFADSSWHNDTCPSYLDEAFGLQVFVDYADLTKREYDGDVRQLGRGVELRAGRTRPHNEQGSGGRRSGRAEAMTMTWFAASAELNAGDRVRFR